MRSLYVEASDLIEMDVATDATVAEIDVCRLEASVELIIRHHFDPTAVHDADLELFARAESLAGGDSAVFLDVGANVANTIASLMALNCRLTVHAFEINPALHAHLHRAAALYPGTCIIHPYGLDSEPRRPWLYIPVLKDLFVLGESTLSLDFIQTERTKTQLRSYLPGETLRVGKLRVETRTLDSAGLSPDFVKIDVEGAEEWVIAGAPETLRRCRPVIMAENSYPQRVETALTPFGYRPYCFDAKSGRLYPKSWPSQNTFYVEPMWAARLQGAGLLGS